MMTENLIFPLHEAYGYVPKRILRELLSGDEVKIQELVAAMEAVCNAPQEFEGSTLIQYGIVILAALHHSAGMALLERIGKLSMEDMEEFFGEVIFDILPLAIAELCKNDTLKLKALICDPIMNPAFRAAALHATMMLIGHKVLAREDLVSFVRSLWAARTESLPYFYDVLLNVSMSIHPGEVIDFIRDAFADQIFDPDGLTLEEVEQFLALPPEAVVAECQAELYVDLSDPILHLQQVLELDPLFAVERNDPCPCDSGLKYKKCCQ